MSIHRRLIVKGGLLVGAAAAGGACSGTTSSLGPRRGDGGEGARPTEAGAPPDPRGPAAADGRASERDAAGARDRDALAEGNTAPAVMGPVDTHVHFYDPDRPGGIPWPPKTDTVLYRRFMPTEYQPIAGPLGIGGVILVEAVWGYEDHAWAFDLAEKTPLIRGIIGSLPVGSDTFADRLATLAKNRTFRGLRVGGGDLTKPAIMENLGALAARGLTVDVNGGAEDLPRLAAIAAALPSLKIVVEHMAGLGVNGKSLPTAWVAGMEACGRLSNVHCKVSALVEKTGMKEIPSDLDYYRPALDLVWKAFGEDRLLFGSNWPVSTRYASLPAVQAIGSRYFTEKGQAAADKFFWKNSKAAYGW